LGHDHEAFRHLLSRRQRRHVLCHGVPLCCPAVWSLIVA
jgi:hypothetical protein